MRISHKCLLLKRHSEDATTRKALGCEYLVFLFLPPKLEGTILFICFNKNFIEM